MYGDKYGNINFGEASKLLVSIIGQDAVLSSLDEYNKKKIKKKLSRIYKEDNVEFIGLGTPKVEIVDEETIKDKKLPQHFTENPQHYFISFFKKLKDDYNVPESVAVLIEDTIWHLFHSCISFTPFEKTKKDTVKYLFRKQIFHLLYNLSIYDPTIQPSLLPKIKKDILVTFFSKIHDLSDTYKLFFKEAAEIITNGNLSMLLRNIIDFVNNDKFTLNLQTISRWDKGTKATWNSIKPVLDYFKERKCPSFVYRFLAIYFLKNAKKALCDLELLEDDEFNKIIIDIITMLIEGKKPEIFYDINFDTVDSGKYLFFINKCLILTELTNNDISSREKIINEIEQMCPKSKVFFSPWLKAKINLPTNEQDIDYRVLREYYRTAFDKGKYYAGGFLWKFLLEAIALEKYQNNLVGNLNDYYAFGYAFEMFTGDKNILLETLDSLKHFTLFEQYNLINRFCLGLHQCQPNNVLSYMPPQTELLFNKYIKLNCEAKTSA
jgi:hypothetical protein